MFGIGSVNKSKPEDLKVDRVAHPGWMTAAERVPTVGEEVYCASGFARLVKLCGKTGNGTRLLELKLAEGKAPAFFAAASNVLVRPIGM
jgi:hypothetical protein